MEHEVENRQCVTCGCVIPEGRVKALPNTRTCVAHSNVQAYVGMNVYSHKTAPELALIDPNSENALEVMRQAERANVRAR